MGSARGARPCPKDARGNLGDDFFNDVQSYLGEPANLKDVCALPLPFTVIFFYFVALVLISTE